MKERTYVVDTQFGRLLKVDDNIKAARKWAWRAFKVGPRCVSVYVRPRPVCERCECRPCLCKAVPR